MALEDTDMKVTIRDEEAQRLTPRVLSSDEVLAGLDACPVCEARLRTLDLGSHRGKTTRQVICCRCGSAGQASLFQPATSGA